MWRCRVLSIIISFDMRSLFILTLVPSCFILTEPFVPLTKEGMHSWMTVPVLAQGGMKYVTHNTESAPLFMNKMKASSSKKKPVRVQPKGFTSSVLESPSFKYTGNLRPGTQSTQNVVLDEHFMKPDYAIDGVPKNKDTLLPWVIEVKTEEQIHEMRAVGSLAREILDIAGSAVKVGITTNEIDILVHEETTKRGAYPSPLNYQGFPKSCCTSVNEVICHGIPDDRQLKEGDILNIDITCYLNGYHGDCSEMFVAGKPKDKSRVLLQTAYDCWIKAMEFVKPGHEYKDIGGIIENYVMERRFTTVKKYCGHGIGSVFHTNPNINHYRNCEPNGRMAVGHTFTIEPMICEGTAQCVTWPDQWTAVTMDGKHSAQFEHTLLVTPDGVEALTGKIETSPLQFWEKESMVHTGFWLGSSKEAKSRASELNGLSGLL